MLYLNKQMFVLIDMLDRFVPLKVLKTITSRANSSFSVRGLANEARVSPAAARMALLYLKKQGVVSIQIVGKTHQYSANLQSALCRQWKILFNLNQLADAKIVEELVQQVPNIQSVLLYGSFAKGTNDEKSDVDLLVITHAPMKPDLGFVNRLGLEVNVSVLSLSEWKKKAATDKVFYENVIFDSIVLFGERPVVL